MGHSSFGKKYVNTAHTIVMLPIVGAGESLFPILILENGEPSLLVAAYTRGLQQENWSPKTIKDAVSAIGCFYDFYTFNFSEIELNQSQRHILLRKFAEARLKGTLQPNIDPTPGELNWQRVKYKTVKKEVDCITKFSQWLADNFNLSPINPLENKYISYLRESNKTAIKMSTALLAHLHTAIPNKNLRPQFDLHNNTGSHFTDIPKSFPPDKVVDLINAATNPRDKMIFLLMAFGSLRISELTHIFLEDVSAIFKDTGESRVVLGHPAEGHYKWVNKIGNPCSGTRAQYLMDVFQRVPRTEMFGTQYWSGWKSMQFGNKENTGFVYWSKEQAGIDFRKLLNQYFDEVFRGKPEGWPYHPYLFVKTQKGNFGEPLTRQNITNQFYAAVEKIGLDRRDEGVNPHGLRHFYGHYCTNLLDLDIRQLQMQLHHACITSTLVYDHMTPEAVREKLLNAQRILLQRESGSIEQEVKDTKIVFPEEWGSSLGDPFGLHSYFHRNGK